MIFHHLKIFLVHHILPIIVGLASSDTKVFVIFLLSICGGEKVVYKSTEIYYFNVLAAQKNGERVHNERAKILKRRNLCLTE